MSGIALRIRMHEAWDDVNLMLPEETSVRDMKRQVLEIVGEHAPDSEFMVKFRGVELRDEALALRDAGIPDDAALIILRRRRRAVR